MVATKADTISQLKKEILSLQGYKPLTNCHELDAGLGPIKDAFPNATFPLGAIHEFICATAEVVSASTGFIGGLLSSLTKRSGVSVWISSRQTIFPPALKLLGIDPTKVIIINLQKERDILWTMEEALKCNGLSAVIGEVSVISFNESRRLQLAVEQSRVTGFIVRRNIRTLNTTACVARWKITPLPSRLNDELPGVGFPRWNVELLKVRNGKPGSWQVECINGQLKHIPTITTMISERRKKTG
jgi:protein ImuA